ncbi:hypothetical protein CBR_g74518 [Chara braunii]|uniref:CCHC-type domain-containing protein n=1 Tax=Chara braunii TaxID=69332 RepID=A0A388JJN4_CHABU|nr:hypothetical protein CBR_g74518 [Chara braunii]|eukprot:GBG41556.1 hypothetical protein CBR_g74518 [Chara braunii]
MQGRYDWTKVWQNALVGKFDDILYRLLRQQKEEREKVKLGEVKDGEIYKTLTCMREMMEGMKEERLKFQIMLAKEKNSKRKGKAPAEEESDSESEEEKEPPRKLTKAERKVLNQIRGGQGTSHKQGKNGGQNNQGGNGGASGGSSGQNSQGQGQFQPQGGRGRGRGHGNGQRNRWASQQEATCNYCAEKGHIMRFCQLLSRDEKEGIVFTTIRGEVLDYEGNLIDPNIEEGMRKEAFRRMGRPLPATFWVASPEEARLAGVDEAMASLYIDDSSAEPGRIREQVVERAQNITRRLAQCRDSIIRLCVGIEESGLDCRMSFSLANGVIKGKMRLAKLGRLLREKHRKLSECGVLVTVGKVKLRSYFYVLPRVEHEVLLGREFLCRSKSIIINKHDETMFVILCDPICGYYEVVKCANTGPYCSRNRLNPESYSLPELLKLRREKESLGEEPNAREFSLTLPDIGQAIDFVSTHAAIDPNVVQALTEIITDTGSAGTMRLIYSPSEGNKEKDKKLPSTREGPFLEGAGLTPAPNVSIRK